MGWHSGGYTRQVARAIWSGAISFGLVNVPVKAYAAVRDHGVHFHQLEKGTGARIRYKKVSEKTSKELEADDIASGYEISRGKYVVVDPEEIDQLRPRTSRTIDITDFVQLSDIDPIYYERTYWLAPDGQGAVRPYCLLLAAMEAEKRAGVGAVVMRNKQYLAVTRPLDGALAMSTMRFADEVIPQSEVDPLPDRCPTDNSQLKLAKQIVQSLTTEWDPKRYHDTYTEELKDLIERRAKGEEIVVEEEEQPRGQVIDLMKALEASLESARGKSGGSRSGAGSSSKKKAAGTSKKAAARKSPAAKKTAARKSPAAKKAAPRKAAPRKAS
jgi:DNA end-binding protein Ku